MITTKTIDDYFTKNYNMLFDYSNKILKKFNKKFDASEPVTEAYLNCIKCVDQKKITEEYQIQQFAKSTIFYKITQGNSNLNRLNKTITTDELSEDIFNIYTIEDINIEEEINQVLDNFKLTLNKYDLRLYEMYYEKQINTAKLLTKHLNISISGAYLIIKEIKEIEIKLRIYVEKYIKIKNNNDNYETIKN